jgi:hypothetical protein
MEEAVMGKGGSSDVERVHVVDGGARGFRGRRGRGAVRHREQAGRGSGKVGSMVKLIP